MKRFRGKTKEKCLNKGEVLLNWFPTCLDLFLLNRTKNVPDHWFFKIRKYPKASKGSRTKSSNLETVSQDESWFADTQQRH